MDVLTAVQRLQPRALASLAAKTGTSETDVVRWALDSTANGMPAEESLASLKPVQERPKLTVVPA